MISVPPNRLAVTTPFEELVASDIMEGKLPSVKVEFVVISTISADEAWAAVNEIIQQVVAKFRGGQP